MLSAIWDTISNTANNHPAIAMPEKYNINKILKKNHIYNIFDMGTQTNITIEKMGSFSKAS